MTASDVRDTSSGAQLLLDTVKRGYPLLVYVGLITGPKEALVRLRDCADRVGIFLLEEFRGIIDPVRRT